MQRKVNLLLLLFSLLGAGIGFAAGEFLLAALEDQAPRFVTAGLYFGVLALFIGLFSLIAELISPRLSGSSWRQRYTDLSWKLLVPATLVLLFVAGALLQVLYQVNYGGIEPPKDLVLVIDNSGSMTETDTGNERFTAAKKLIGKMEDDMRVSIVLFSDKAEVLKPFVNVGNTAERTAIESDLNAVEQPDGGTDFNLALGKALDIIHTKDDPGRGTAVILLSDGFSETPIDQQLQELKEQQIKVHTIALSVGDYKSSGLLEQIATETGGSYNDVTEAGELTHVFQNIYDALDDRLLVTWRQGLTGDSMLYSVLRIAAVVLLGAAIGLSLGMIFDNRYLARSFGIGGAAGGLLAGLILENGLSGGPFADGLVRLAAALVLAAVIALFTLVIPVKENSRLYRSGGSAVRTPVTPGRARNSRSSGF
ncbi:vWA domain-containing protein [Paenibacillus pinihumi]|uniref:vWA domain-containing protein n=1 Tax=Paenibacillus pinihumi TaxID=669462 RepID=UPI00040D458F|nr:vWA domain-containing protein [Paenibacillus pinihumi]